MSEISTVGADDQGYSRPGANKPRAGTSLAVVSHAHGLLPETIPTEAESTDTTLLLARSGGSEVLAPEIQQQLHRMLQSPIFIHSNKLSRFLRFIVQHVICDNPDCLKEYVIGCEVYDRRPPYHPSLDSIVRTEARRLRAKLKEYYEAEGKDDPVYIYLRPGSYIPAFRSSATPTGTHGATNSVQSAHTSTIPIGLLPFRDLSGTPLSSRYARGIPDELVYALRKNEGWRVISPASMAYFDAQEHDFAATMSKAGARVAVEGSVKAQATQIRITVRILDAAGFQLWTERFDTEANSQAVFFTEEQIAAALSAGLDALFRIATHPASAKKEEDDFGANALASSL